MTYCKTILYSKPTDQYKGITAWTNVGSGVLLLRGLKLDGKVSDHYVQVPRGEFHQILDELYTVDRSSDKRSNKMSAETRLALAEYAKVRDGWEDKETSISHRQELLDSRMASIKGFGGLIVAVFLWLFTRESREERAYNMDSADAVAIESDDPYDGICALCKKPHTMTLFDKEVGWVCDSCTEAVAFSDEMLREAAQAGIPIRRPTKKDARR